MSLSVRRYAFIFAFLFLMPLAILASLKSGLFRVQKIEVTSTQNLEAYQQDYLKTLNARLQMYTGVNLWDAPIEQILQKAQAESWIRTARVVRRLPNVLRLEIEAREGLALLLDKKGKLQVLAEEGRILPEIEETNSPRLPVLQEPKVQKDSKLRNQISQLLSALPREGAFSLSSIAELELDREGAVWFQHLATKSKIKLGEENITLKTARVARVLEYLHQNNLGSRVINADFSRKVVVKVDTSSSLKK